MPQPFHRPVRRGLLAGLLGAAALATAPAWAQQQPVRLVVGYAAGGPVDTAARQFAQVFGRELGRTVIVENKAGVAGALGGETVARATPDGSVLYFGASPTLTITPHVIKSMPFDTVKDLTPLSPVLSYANALVINKDLPIQNLKELIAYAKANPGKVSYGSAGMGASNHLSGELFAKQSGIALTHVPYKGNAPAMTDVIGGQLTMMFDIVSTARNYIQTNRVRPLVVTSRERNASLPDVPTMREAGLPGYEVIGWYGVYGPAHMKTEQVALVNTAVNRTLGDEGLRKLWAEQGYDMWSGAPAVLAEQQRKDLEMWRGVTKDIKFE
ncbi:tripartite tricarboxylate transporter substrate binding protein [Pseudorhodoferax sp. Leaf265]|uniref:Bug family tripartite tricarboxylate transporter substrate binding protein n=1 Tax=Pseudorhodoferax sp. Leaf265 TaxID=1736315 RepID=UPI0006F640C9|nr:tripartite tricarboxylate transporter substrate binding protein [Pseudorhodoferax sp. Leaf265]KQP15601.1 ABC transporter substrate-binding protein [Pseudorhodoferax sp. Leaf265]